MSIVTLDKICKHYAGKEILREVSCTIERSQRIGLIGRNGTGKSTLLKILAGIEEYSNGELSLGKGISVGYLEQDPDFSPNATMYEVMLQAFAPVLRLKEKLHTLEQALAKPEISKDPELLEKYLTQYGRVQEQFESADGYQIETRIRTIIFGLQFSENDLWRPMVTFSGGERIRVAFAKLLLSAPDLLLLDEPTNHLDLQAIEWVEQYLQSYPGSVIIVSHDRVFLDHVVTLIYELDGQKIDVYHGNYSRYIEEKKLRELAQIKAYTHQQAKIQQLERNIARFKAGTRSTQAKHMEKRLAKMERVQMPKKAGKTMHLSFEPVEDSGRVVVECSSLTARFDENTLFEKLNLKIERGERVAVTGPNGSGKSTLLRIIAKDLEPVQGTIQFGVGVEVGYFSQHFDTLDPELTIYENIYRIKPMDRFQMHSFLGRFLFSGDDVQQVVGLLSGGEKNRVALAALLARQPNLLLLDEPTNHLDLATREVLISTLRRFPGTIIFISHDRYMIQELATRKLEFPLFESV